MNIEVKGLDATLKKFERLATQSKGDIQGALNDFADRTASDAKRLAPADEGKLRQSISPVYGDLQGGVVANINNAAYLEFGTRKFAAQHVATLPQDWQKIASGYQGKGKGDYYDFLNAILDWVKSKGIVDTYSVSTKRRNKRSGKEYDSRLLKAAEAIAWSILRNGIKAQPYLYPAINNNTEQLKKDIQDIFK